MAINYKNNLAQFVDLISVEEAETLLGWLQGHPKGKVDLSACTHVHPANLQVLMAAKAKVSKWPADTSLSDWLKPALMNN